MVFVSVFMCARQRGKKKKAKTLMSTFIFQVALYNTDQEGSDSPRSSLNNSLSDQSLASVNLNSVHSYTPVRSERSIPRKRLVFGGPNCFALSWRND